MMRTSSGNVLIGDWRSSAYGGARRAHLWIVRPGETRAVPACDARIRRDTTARVRTRPLRDLCYDCLAYGVRHGRSAVLPHP